MDCDNRLGMKLKPLEVHVKRGGVGGASSMTVMKSMPCHFSFLFFSHVLVCSHFCVEHYGDATVCCSFVMYCLLLHFLSVSLLINYNACLP